VPRAKQLFIEDEWDIVEPTSLFVYPEPGLLEAVVERRAWPKLRLIVIHNGDNQANYTVLIPFLNANPQLCAWVQNNTVTHPRIRSLPSATRIVSGVAEMVPTNLLHGRAAPPIANMAYSIRGARIQIPCAAAGLSM